MRTGQLHSSLDFAKLDSSAAYLSGIVRGVKLLWIGKFATRLRPC
jgi:hypothetical protein